MGEMRTTEGRRTARLVAARLQQLGRPTDLLTDDALAELCQDAQGSPARLHALLASALFLASTEDAGAIEADHVRRAALSLGTEPPVPAPAPARTRRVRAAVMGAGACVLAGLAVELAALRHPPSHTPLPVRPSPPAVSPPQVQKPAQPAATAIAHPAPIKPAPTPAAKAPPTPPPAPLPPAPPPVALPQGPPAAVIIRYKAGDKAGEARARVIAARLASAHFAVEMRAEPRLKHASVGFFYQEDRDLAVQVADAAGLPGPVRENPFDAATLPHPGTIEVALP